MTAYAAQRFWVLDGMRGLAAILVMQRHGPEFFGPEFGSTYLAVDMFFCLSGFVVASSYERRLQTGDLTGPVFLGLRLLRLWPLYLLAIVAMAVGALVVGRGVATESLILAALYLPTPQSIGGNTALFPALFVAWSLSWEIIANAAYGFTARWLTNRILIGVLTLAFAGLVATALHFGTLNVGFFWSGFLGGGARAVFAFFAGVLAYRLRPAERISNGWAIMVGLTTVLLMPGGAAYDLAAAAIVLPLLIHAASACRPSAKSAAVFAAAGAASYPLYLLHFPAFRFGANILGLHAGFASGLMLTAILLVGCWCVDRYLDRPLRRFLARQIPAFSPRKFSATASANAPPVTLRRLMRHEPADTISTET